MLKNHTTPDNLLALSQIQKHLTVVVFPYGVFYLSFLFSLWYQMANRVHKPYNLLTETKPFSTYKIVESHSFHSNHFTIHD